MRRRPKLRILTSGESSFLIGGGKAHFFLSYDSQLKDWNLQRQSPKTAKNVSKTLNHGESSVSYIARSQNMLATASIYDSSIKIFERHQAEWRPKAELSLARSGIELSAKLKPSGLYFYSVLINDKFIVLMAAISEKWSSMCIFRRVNDDWQFALEQQTDLSSLHSSKGLRPGDIIEHFEASEDRIIIQNFDVYGDSVRLGANEPLCYIFKNESAKWILEETILRETFFSFAEDFEIQNLTIRSDKLAVLFYSPSKKSSALYILQLQQNKWNPVWRLLLREHGQKALFPRSLSTKRYLGEDSISLLSFINDETLLVGSLVIRGPHWRVVGETVFSGAPNTQPNPKDKIYSNGSTAIELVDQEVRLWRRQGFKYELEKSFSLEKL